jgi:RNase P subunit RPR2
MCDGGYEGKKSRVNIPSTPHAMFAQPCHIILVWKKENDKRRRKKNLSMYCRQTKESKTYNNTFDHSRILDFSLLQGKLKKNKHKEITKEVINMIRF